jgi:hypothetical protein
VNLTITCKYSCRCGIRDAEVEVPARTTEEVVDWVERVLGAAIGADHMKRSPHCRATEMEHVKIPMLGSDRVGGAPVQ